jgi:hypothetical protein
VLGLFLGTGVAYYTVRVPMYTHLYGFFLLSLLLYSAHRWQTTGRGWWWLLQWVALALAVAVRPTNLLWLPLLLAYPLLQPHWRRWLPRWPWVVAVVVMVGLLALPQLHYWQHIHGRWVHYSYAGETFRWATLQIHWWAFSPQNGLFPYWPIVLLALLGGGWALFRVRHPLRWLLAGVLLVAGYVLSSWWAWDYGCAFGQRSFTEYTPLLALPLALLLQQARHWALPWRVTLMGALATAIVPTVRFVELFDGCGYTRHVWDWAWYVQYFLQL